LIFPSAQKTYFVGVVNQPLCLGFFFRIEKKPILGEVENMKKTVNAYHDQEPEDNENNAVTDSKDYWDIEDRLYEQYKELRIDAFREAAEEARGD
jgi:hypothetical protein